MGPAVGADAAAAARPRGSGPRPHLRPAGALPADVRRGQHAGGHPDHPGELLPPAAPPGPVAQAQAAGGLHAEVAAAAQAGRLVGGGLHHRHASSRCIRDTGVTARRRQAVQAGAALLRQGLLRPVQARAERGITDTAIVRMEQLYPLPVEEVQAALGAVPERRGLRLGAGGAGQPGRLVVRRAQPAGAPRGRTAAADLPPGGGRAVGRLDQDCTTPSRPR